MKLRIGYTVVTVVIFFMSACFYFGCHESGKAESVITVDRVSEIINDSAQLNHYIILDLRSRMDYVRGHLVPAIWMHKDSLANKAEYLPTKMSIILYDVSGRESLKAAILLLKRGFENIYVMEGGFSQWMKRGYPAAIQLVKNTSNRLTIGKKRISPGQLRHIIETNDNRYAIIDIRSRIAFGEGHIRNAISIPYLPLNEFVVNVEEKNFPANKRLVIYSDNDTHTLDEKAIDVLLRNDYTEVYLLEEGIEGCAKTHPDVID